jgi:hypothetical protein
VCPPFNRSRGAWSLVGRPFANSPPPVSRSSYVERCLGERRAHAVVNKALSDEALAYVAAGPLEDLLTFHGPALIDHWRWEWLLVCVRLRVFIGETSFTYGRHGFVSFLSMEFVRWCGGGSGYAGKVILRPDAMQRLRQPISAARTS